MSSCCASNLRPPPVTRDLTTKAPVGKARYTIVSDEHGGIVNDPVLLRVAEDEIWLSTHAEVLHFARRLRVNSGLDVRIGEIDVSPLQLQGPNSKPMMEQLVADGRIGREVLDLSYYTLCQTTFDGVDMIVSRTSFSGEVGHELYPFNASDSGETVWDGLLDGGRDFGIQVIAPSHIRRLEAGILSYHSDMHHNTNPYEIGLAWQVDLDKPNFVGQDALRRIEAEDVNRQLAGIKFGGLPLTWYNESFWSIYYSNGNAQLGYVTSAFHSPRLGNLGLAMLLTTHSALETSLRVAAPRDGLVTAEVAPTPFHDPPKATPRQ